MTHFDRTDLLHSKKQVWGGFRNLPDLCGPICEFSRFFRKFQPGHLIVKNRFFYLSSPKKMLKNLYFFENFNFPKNYIEMPTEWYIYFPPTPSRSLNEFLFFFSYIFSVYRNFANPQYRFFFL